MKIKIKKLNHPDKFIELQWNEKERLEVESKVLGLRNDQIAALFFLTEIKFSKNDIENVVAEIKMNKHESLHLDVLIAEADSKENLLWWVDFFTKANRSKK